MKKIIFLFGFFISTVGFAQINSFNETTQLLNKPHGKPVLQINAGVEYNYYYPGYADVYARRGGRELRARRGNPFPARLHCHQYH